MTFPDRRPDYPPDDRPARRPEPSLFSRPLVLLLAVALGIGLGSLAYWAGSQLVQRVRRADPPATNPDAKPREVVPSGPLDAEETEAHDLFERCKGSVVSVNLVVQERDRFDLTLLERKTGAGSGVVWDDEGRVVTNYHVVADVEKYRNMVARVVLWNGARVNARVVGLAPNYDLAVIQMVDPPEKPRKIQVGTSADLKVGQKAFALGNPFELPGTLTKGIVSALDRATAAPTGGVIAGCIQHTAPINPGNSGGPLLNRFGRLIGVNASITSPSGGNVGIGFAIPVDTVNEVVTELIRTGRLPKPDLGVVLVDPQLLRRNGIRGALVAEVTPDGPAEQAGLRGWQVDPRTGQRTPGDLIVAVNGQPINTAEDYQRAVARLNPGDKVTVRFVRNRKEQQADLTVQGV